MVVGYFLQFEKYTIYTIRVHCIIHRRYIKMNMDIILIVAISVSFVVSNKLLERYGKKSMRNMDIPNEINVVGHMIALAFLTFFM